MCHESQTRLYTIKNEVIYDESSYILSEGADIVIQPNYQQKKSEQFDKFS